MPGNFEREDLRILKTRSTLMTAMSKLLERVNFNQITVNDLCVEALISRSTFYSHFKDKYDLLKYWLADKKIVALNVEHTYEYIEKKVNDYANSHKNTIKNLVENANSETFELLCDYVLSLLNINIDRAQKGTINPNDIVLSSICCGGLINYLLWQVNNKFPEDLLVMNPYIYDVLLSYQRWDEDRAYAMDNDLLKK